MVESLVERSCKAFYEKAKGAGYHVRAPDEADRLAFAEKALELFPGQGAVHLATYVFGKDGVVREAYFRRSERELVGFGRDIGLLAKSCVVGGDVKVWVNLYQPTPHEICMHKLERGDPFMELIPLRSRDLFIVNFFGKG